MKKQAWVWFAMIFCAADFAAAKITTVLIDESFNAHDERKLVALIFAVAQWDTSRSLSLNANVNRPFAVDFSQSGYGKVYFFGERWTEGVPVQSAFWARRAVAQGRVGIAPDYRTKNRFGTSPLASAADSRVAFNWVVEHADQLGIDPKRIAAGGSSAGAHVALWTAITATPPKSRADEVPSVKRVVLLLGSAFTDTSDVGGYTRCASETMLAPVLMFHACDDELVSYSSAIALCRKVEQAGSFCELISVAQGGYGYATASPEWKQKVRTKVEAFLKRTGLLPAVS